MRKTKIVCTLGPATDEGDILKELILAGMNVARFNFSHGSHDDHAMRLEKLMSLRNELKFPIAALLDTKGPEIRLKSFAGGKIFLEDGATFTLTTREVIGNTKEATITYGDLFSDISAGAALLIDDGSLELKVTEINGSDIVCEVVNGGYVSNNKSINVPGTTLSMDYMSAVDRSDILFGIEKGFDFIAASFVRCAADILEIRKILTDNNASNIKIIAKIENRSGVDNIDEILEAADGIMVARGDMGVEIDFTEIPIIQKSLILSSYMLGKPVITATQMLDSMIEHPRPTRAEITDVANAIYDGTSAIMLSGETAAGKYPVEAVQTLAAIAEKPGSVINYNKQLRDRSMDSHIDIPDAVAHSACTTAMDLQASSIITISLSGATARLISKYRPAQPILACVTKYPIYRQLALSWGIIPHIMPIVATTDEAIDKSSAIAAELGYASTGELTVITAGVPLDVSGNTNMIKVHIVE